MPPEIRTQSGTPESNPDPGRGRRPPTRPRWPRSRPGLPRASLATPNTRLPCALARTPRAGVRLSGPARRRPHRSLERGSLRQGERLASGRPGRPCDDFCADFLQFGCGHPAAPGVCPSMSSCEQVIFPPLPGDHHPAAGHSLRDLPPHRGVPPRQPQRDPDRALPPGPPRSARHPVPVALRRLPALPRGYRHPGVDCPGRPCASRAESASGHGLDLACISVGTCHLIRRCRR